MISYQEPKYIYPASKEEQEERLTQCHKLSALFFRRHIMPTLIYGILYTLFMFHNHNSFTMTFWVVETILYCLTVFKINEVEFRWNKENVVYASIMVLLGVSSMLTTNSLIVTLNYLGFFLVLVVFLLHNIYEDKCWQMGHYLRNLIMSVAGAIGSFYRPVADLIAYAKEDTHKEKSNTLFPILIGLVCALPCLMILGFCLAQADAVFDELLISFSTKFFSFENVIQAFFLFLFGFGSAYCGIRYLFQFPLPQAKSEQKQIKALAPITFLSMICLMYIVFCAIQIIYLFAGFGSLPEGMTYAQYARTGFFQLLFVCCVNLVLILLTGKYVTKNKVLNVILTIFSICTFIMIASSTYRMLLYIDTYYLTFTRVFVLVALTLLTFLMVGAVIFIFKNEFPIFRYSMLVVSVIYLCFSFSKVDYWIADYNLSHCDANALAPVNPQDIVTDDYETYTTGDYDEEESSGTHQVGDLQYLSTLSLDACSAMTHYLSEEQLAAYAKSNQQDLSDTSLWHFNLSRAIGQKKLGNRIQRCK